MFVRYPLKFYSMHTSLQKLAVAALGLSLMVAAPLASAQTTSTTPVTIIMIGNVGAGSHGDGVKLLQTLLASDPSLFQGTVTGFFGPVTKSAVKKFQKK